MQVHDAVRLPDCEVNPQSKIRNPKSQDGLESMPCMFLVTQSDEVFHAVCAMGQASGWEVRRHGGGDALPPLHEFDTALFDLVNGLGASSDYVDRVSEASPFLPIILLSHAGSVFPERGAGLRYHVDPNRLYDIEHILISLSLSTAFDVPPPVELQARSVPRVLIVDDNVQLATLIGRTFRSLEKYDVQVTSSGFEAISLLPVFLPDIVVVDLVLNDMDGREICLFIRGHEKLKHTKVVAVSGYLSKERVQDSPVQFDAFLEKPFRMQDILNKVTAFLK